LKKIFPFGRILTNVYAEIHDGKNTILRQPGTYPITCYVNRKIELKKFYNLIIINHGYRSLTCLVNPVNLLTLTLKELESIDGIGKKRALSIKGKIPSTLTEWKVLLPEIWEKLSLIQPDILK